MFTDRFDPELFEILETECFIVRYDVEQERIRAYLTDFYYAEPEIIRTNDELLAFVREIVKTAYDGIEECIPDEYLKYMSATVNAE